MLFARKLVDWKQKARLTRAIEALEADLQTKESVRDAAEQRLQESRNLLTEKQTAYVIGEKQFKESTEKFETARQTLF